MAWTAAETERIVKIEKVITKLSTAINNLASKQQLAALTVLKTNEITELKNKIASLESQLALLQNP